MHSKYDVIVVGGGPGGAAAAKKCAENDLRTLLLERDPLPRDKVCSGMVMGEWAQKILRAEFGEIPEQFLAEPRFLVGYAVHVPGAAVQTLDIRTPISWRKHLDGWMCRRAAEAGSEVWDAARVISVTEADGRYVVELNRQGQTRRLESRFIVGADGARSTVRASLFPNLKPTYSHCYRECYDVRLDLPERRFNFFSTIQTAPFYFCTHDKDGVMLMEGGAPVGKINETAAQSRQYLIEHHGLAPNVEPLWRDGCVEPILYHELFTRSFRPAKGNALLVGDAAGLNMPVTGEGVGTSLKSGLEAALAILATKQGGEKAEGAYLKKIDEFITKFQDIYAFSRRIKEAASKNDPGALSDALLESWRRALQLF